MSLAEKGKQRVVDFVGVCPQKTVRSTIDLDVFRGGQQSVERAAGGVDGQDAVGGTVQDQGGYRSVADRGHVGPEIGDPGRDRRPGGEPRRPGGNVPAGLQRLLAEPGAEVFVGVVEVGVEGGEISIPVGRDRAEDSVERALVDAGGVILGLEQERLERGKEGDLLILAKPYMAT